MIHTTFTIDEPAAALPAETTPGGYMRACRLQAGKTIQECVDAIAVHQGDRVRARHDIMALERDEPGDYGRLVQHLQRRRAFPFSMATFAALAAATADAAFDEWADI